MARAVALAFVALVLAGCGGTPDQSSTTEPDPSPPPFPVVHLHRPGLPVPALGEMQVAAGNLTHLVFSQPPEDGEPPRIATLDLGTGAWSIGPVAPVGALGSVWAASRAGAMVAIGTVSTGASGDGHQVALDWQAGAWTVDPGSSARWPDGLSMGIAVSEQGQVAVAVPQRASVAGVESIWIRDTAWEAQRTAGFIARGVAWLAETPYACGLDPTGRAMIASRDALGVWTAEAVLDPQGAFSGLQCRIVAEGDRVVAAFDLSDFPVAPIAGAPAGTHVVQGVAGQWQSMAAGVSGDLRGIATDAGSILVLMADPEGGSSLHRAVAGEVQACTLALEEATGAVLVPTPGGPFLAVQGIARQPDGQYRAAVAVAPLAAAEPTCLRHDVGALPDFR